MPVARKESTTGTFFLSMLRTMPEFAFCFVLPVLSLQPLFLVRKFRKIIWLTMPNLKIQKLPSLLETCARDRSSSKWTNN